MSDFSYDEMTLYPSNGLVAPPISTKKLSQVAKLPVMAKKGDGALDVFASEEKTVPAGSTVVVGTGLAMAIPDGWQLDIRSKSGLASKGIFVTNSPGLIDSSYRGEVGVVLTNLSEKPHFINIGDKIAQCQLTPVYDTVFVDIGHAMLPETDRGTGGFGSTGP